MPTSSQQHLLVFPLKPNVGLLDHLYLFDQGGRRLSDSLKEPCAVPYHHPTLSTGERFVRTRDQDISALFDQLLELSAGDQNHRVDRVMHEDRLGTMHIRGFTNIANGLWE